MLFCSFESLNFVHKPYLMLLPEGEGNSSRIGDRKLIVVRKVAFSSFGMCYSNLYLSFNMVYSTHLSWSRFAFWSPWNLDRIVALPQFATVFILFYPNLFWSLWGKSSQLGKTCLSRLHLHGRKLNPKPCRFLLFLTRKILCYLHNYSVTENRKYGS